MVPLPGGGLLARTEDRGGRAGGENSSLALDLTLAQVSYKVYATHMASQHGALEMVMLDEGPEARWAQCLVTLFCPPARARFVNSLLPFDFRTASLPVSPGRWWRG